MEHKENKVVDKVVKSYTCDICSIWCRHVHCSKCNRDVCGEHLVYFSHDKLGDGCSRNSYTYQNRYRICTECWAKGREYREAIIDLRRKSRKEEDELFTKWNESCKGV